MPSQQEPSQQDLAGQYAQLSQRLGQSQNVPQPALVPYKFPTRESIGRRIVETAQLLELLKEVDALLAAHPDLERLIGTLRRLGQL